MCEPYRFYSFFNMAEWSDEILKALECYCGSRLLFLLGLLDPVLMLILSLCSLLCFSFTLLLRVIISLTELLEP